MEDRRAYGQGRYRKFNKKKYKLSLQLKFLLLQSFISICKSMESELDLCEQALSSYLRKLQETQHTFQKALSAVREAKISMKQLPDVAASNDLSRKLLSDVEAMVQLCNSGGPHFEESGNQHERTESPNTNVDDTSDVKSGDECLTQKYPGCKPLNVEVTSSLGGEGTFWCLPTESGKLMAKLEEISEKLRKETLANKDLWKCDFTNPNQVICVLSKNHNIWLRGVIEKEVSREEVVVRYVDLGKTEKVLKSRLNRTPEELSGRPFHALNCCLFKERKINIPYDARWRFKDLTHRQILSLSIEEELDGGVVPLFFVNLKGIMGDADINAEVHKIVVEKSRGKTQSQPVCKDIRYYPSEGQARDESITLLREVHKSSSANNGVTGQDLSSTNQETATEEDGKREVEEGAAGEETASLEISSQKVSILESTVQEVTMEGSTRKERSHEELSGTTASFTENEHDSSSEVELSHDKDSKLEITLPDASRQDWGDICQTPKTEYEEIEFLPVVDFAEDIEEEDEDTQEEKSPVEISDQETEKCKAPSAEGGDSTEPISPKSSDNVPGIDTNNNNDKVCTDIHDNSQDVQTTGLPVVSLPADSITNPSQVQEKLIEHKAENIINSKGNMKEGHIGSEMLGNSAATPVTDVPSHDEERKDSLVQDEGSRSSDEDKAFAIQGHQNEQQFDNGDASLEWDDYHQHQMRSEQPDGQIVHSHDQIVRNQIESRRIHNQAEWPQDHRKRSFDHNERSHRKREEWTEGQHARNQNQRLHNQADCHHDQRGGSSDQGERFHGRTHDQADLSHDRKGQSYGQSERPHSKREEWAEGQKTYDQAEWSHDHKGRSFDHKDRFHGKKDNWTEGHKMHDQNQRPLSQVHWSNDQKGRSSEQKDRFHGKKEGMYDQIHLDQGWVNSQLEGLSDSVLINPQTRFIVLSGNIQRFLYGLRNNSFTPDIESLDNFSKILDGFKENPVVFILLRSHSRDEYHDIRIGGIAVACSPLYAVPYNDTERMQLDVKYLSTAKQSRKWDEKFVNGGEISSDKANFLFKQLRADILSGVARDIRSERPPQKDALGSNKPRHREREMGHEKHRRMDAGRRIPMWEEIPPRFKEKYEFRPHSSENWDNEEENQGSRTRGNTGGGKFAPPMMFEFGSDDEVERDLRKECDIFELDEDDI